MAATQGGCLDKRQRCEAGCERNGQTVATVLHSYDQRAGLTSSGVGAYAAIKFADFNCCQNAAGMGAVISV